MHLFKSKKRQNQTAYESLSARLDSLEQLFTDGSEKLTEVTQHISKLETSLRKHDMALEDLLDEWAEKSSDEAAVKEKFRQFGQTENSLLSLLEAYQEQFFSLRRFATGKDEALNRQLTLMEQNLEQYRLLCGITIIGQCNVPVDYSLHEVIEAVDTSNPEQDKQITCIYREGYLYKGQVKRKAQVSAYRFQNNILELNCNKATAK